MHQHWLTAAHVYTSTRSASLGSSLQRTKPQSLIFSMSNIPPDHDDAKHFGFPTPPVAKSVQFQGPILGYISGPKNRPSLITPLRESPKLSPPGGPKTGPKTNTHFSISAKKKKKKNPSPPPPQQKPSAPPPPCSWLGRPGGSVRGFSLDAWAKRFWACCRNS